MKEFENWFEKNKPYTTYSCMDMAPKAWKAALEWIKYAGVLGPSLANDLIDEELKE